MIFVTVGTHEQPFDRLVQAIDQLKNRSSIQDTIFIQTGYSSYQPRNCEWSPFCSDQEMVERTQEPAL